MSKERVRSIWVDGILITLALIFAGLYYFHAQWVQSTLKNGESLGSIESGTGKIKPRGSRKYKEAYPGDKIYDLDSIWIGPNQKATLILIDGSTVSLEEKTLLIIKKPFKSGTTGNLELKLVSGGIIRTTLKGVERIEVREGATQASTQEKPVKKITETKSEENHPKNEPLEPEKVKILPKVHPAPNSMILLAGKTSIKLTFSWPDPLSGTFTLVDLTTNKKFESNIVNQIKFDHLLDRMGHEYAWTITDINGHQIIGPLKFKLDQYSGQDLDQSIKNGSSDQTIYVY